MMYVDGTTADTLFDATRKFTLFDNPEIPVVSPQHLIALKLFAAHNDPQRKYKEFGDVQELLHRVTIDKSSVRNYFVKYGFEEFYEEIFDKKK